MKANDIARLLARSIESLVRDLLPGGKRVGHEWCVAAINSPFGCSVSVHLTGSKAGVWSAWAADIDGDALDLVRAVLDVDMAEALRWSRRWLGIEDGAADLPTRPAFVPADKTLPDDPNRWRRLWEKAVPIVRTPAATYLAARGLEFADPHGRVLRFEKRRARNNEADELEYHPALLAALSDIFTGEQCGIINIYLRPDGSDRIRDGKGKTNAGRAKNAAVMLSPFDEPTYGLTTCEGVETGIAVLMSGLAPLWACGSAGVLSSFPVLSGIEALTIAGDTDNNLAGQKAAAAVIERWRNADRQAVVIAPPAGDWADLRRTVA